MRLADTPAPLRAGGQADAVPAGHHRTAAAGRDDSAPALGANAGDPVFDAAVAALEAGRDAVASVRDDLELEGWPAPKRLAPHAVALAATAFRDGEEAGEGKLMLLYDPAGQDGWTGTFRIVIQVQADVEEEMAADPLLGEVGWSWLTDALDLHAPGYAAPSGTVTRVITEGYGAKSDDLPATGFELRASWCPADGGDLDGDELASRDRRRRRRLVRAARVGGRAARGGHARDRQPGREGAGGRTRARPWRRFRFRRAARPMTAASEESEEQTPEAVALSADADGPVADGSVADGSVADGSVADGSVADGPWLADGDEAAADEKPEREVIDLLEPREGLPPVIATPEDLAAAVERLAAGTGPVAVDAERASGYRYGQRAYLVQLRRAGAGTVLIDPVGAPDLSGLDAALADVEAVLHAASQDLPCLAEIGYRPRELFDTELAGRLLGYPRVALGTMLDEVLGFRLAKEHSAADWSIRPLPTEMLKYAALDVEILTELRDALADQLDAEGKTEWARQEFAAIAAAPPAPPRVDPWRRTSGIHKVRTRRSLAVVRELWQERDEVAREADLSPRRVLADQAIIEAARAEAGKVPPVGRPQLDRINGFHARNARKHSARWQAAVLRARELDEGDLPEVAGATATGGPPPAHRWAERDPAAAARLAAGRETVTALATANRLPAENLLPPDALRRLAWEPPAPATPEAITATLTGFGARPWQAELTAGPLAEAFAAATEAAAG